MKTIFYLSFCLIIALQSCAQKPTGYINVSSDSLNTLLKDEHGILIDVRTPEEYAAGHIPGAININYNDPKFEDVLDTLNKELVYEVYCRSGGRSELSVETMSKMGFKNIYHLENGILEWEKKGLPIVR